MRCIILLALSIIAVSSFELTKLSSIQSNHLLKKSDKSDSKESGSSISDSNDSSSNDSDSSKSSSEEVEGPSELPNGCPADEDPQNPTHLPHPTDCRKFYKCDNGVPVLQRCPAGLWWSSAADWCDYPEKSDCGNPGGNNPSTEVPESSESDSSESDSSKSSSEEVEGPSELPNGCPADEDPQNPTHLPHPTDCRKFYKCDNGVPVLQRCPAGLWWSSAADWCDYPEKSDCGNPGGNNPSTEVPESSESDSSESDSSKSSSEEVEGPSELPNGCPADEDPQNPTHVPHPTDCRKFYKCDNGVPVLQRCPAGLWWSSAADWCDYPEKSDCGNPGGNNPSTEVPESSESDSSESDSSKSSSEEVEGPSELPNGCPADEDPQNPTHLPHPTDCRKFYKCDNGVPVLQRCPAGLWWSSAADWCDYPEKSDCGNPGGNNPSAEVPESSESDSSESDSTKSSSEEVEGPSELPNGCPADEDPQNPTHLPHPTDCRKFYKCDNGVPVLQRCPAGLWWSSAADWCDYPEKSDCGNPGGNNPSTEVPESSESDSSESDSSKSSSEESEGPSELPNGCPADEDPQNPTHLPHPTDCRKFYKCDNGVPVLQRCPAGLWWSSAADWCDYPEKSDCGNPGGNNPSTEVPESSESDSSESDSSKSSSEEVEGPSELPNGCPADEDPQNPTHLPHPTDCRKFYKCDNGVPVLQRCPAGLWWSSAADWCDYPEKSDCGNPGGNNPSMEVPESSESDSSESDSSKSSSEEAEGPSELPNGCPADEDPQNPTHLPHPTDCRKFYKCDNGVPVLQRCPAGLWWSSAADWCDYPEKSDCGNPGGNNPSTEVPESSESDSSESDSSKSSSEEVEGPSELPNGCPADEDPHNPTHLPHPTDCRKFYKCDNGVPVLQRCPAGLWWSSAADWCDYPEKSDCGNPGGNNPSTEVPESSESDSSESDSSKPSSEEVESPSELPNGCPADEDPQNPTHLPHPTDCRKFYKCDNGVPVLQRCPAGLWWSSAADWCDYPEKSDCGNPGGNNPSTEVPESSESDSSESDSSKSSSEEVEGPSELPNGCPADEDPHNPTHLPHPTDCRKFYKCDNGVPVLQRCPAGLWWSSAADWCDYPEKSDCGNPGGNNPSTEVPESSESDSSESDSSKPSSEEVESPSELPNGCPADEDPQNPTHLPHPTDCRKFYKCDNGVPVLQRCPAGLWWSSAADWCDYPEKSDCGNPGGNNPSAEVPESSESDSSESDSSKPSSEEVESPSELPNGCPADEDPQNPTHLPHPTDCRKFYECDNGVPVLQRCPAGLWWSSAADWCDYPDKSDCGFIVFPNILGLKP